TLVDASRSLGATWVTTFWRVLIPNLTSAIVSSAFLTATVVLGEFTIANNLLRTTFPVFTLQYAARSSQGGTALALLGLFTVFTRRRARQRGSKVIVNAAEGPA